MAQERIQITIEGVDAFSQAFKHLQAQFGAVQRAIRDAEGGFSNLQATIVTLNHIQEARDRITAALVGLAVVAAAWAVMLIIQYFFGISILDGNITPPKAY